MQWQAHAVAADASWYALKLAAVVARHQLQQLLGTALQQKHQRLAALLSSDADYHAVKVVRACAGEQLRSK